MYSIYLFKLVWRCVQRVDKEGGKKCFQEHITQQGEKISSKQQCNPFYLKNKKISSAVIHAFTTTKM